MATTKRPFIERHDISVESSTLVAAVNVTDNPYASMVAGLTWDIILIFSGDLELSRPPYTSLKYFKVPTGAWLSCDGLRAQAPTSNIYF